MPTLHRFVAALATLCVIALPSPAQPRAKKSLTVADYGRWSSIGAVSLSSDGKWMAYVQTPNTGDSTLVIKNLDTDVVTSVAGGSAPRFSDDARWVGYSVVTVGAPRTPPTRRFEILNLATSVKRAVPNVGAFIFTKGSRFVAMKLNRPAGQTTGGTLLLLRELVSGVDRPIGNVDLFAFSPDASLLAYTLDVPERLGNGAYVYTLETGVTTPLSTGAFDYSGLVWHASRQQLAVLRGDRPAGKRQRDNTLMVWSDVGTAEQTVVEVDASAVGRPGYIISEFTSPQFNRDGSRAYFGIKKQEAEPPRTDAPQANVDIWHWMDAEAQTQQVVQLAAARRATYSAILHLATKRVVAVGDSSMRTIVSPMRGSWAIGRIDTAYRAAVTWFTPKADYYRVNQQTGERTLIDRALQQTLSLPPSGEYFVYVKNERLHAYHFASGTTKALDASIDVVDNDAQGGGIPSGLYGFAGWSRDGRSALVHSQFDVFAFPLDGSKAVNLTGGAGARDQIRFRIVQIPGTGDGEPGIDLTKPLMLSAQGEWTKRSGYYTLAPGGALTPLLFTDKAIGDAQKAEKADRMIFTQQTATEFPDYWVATASFASPKKVTDANPFLSEYAWTPKRVLVEYKNRFGRRLQGTLTLPANYEPGKKYPMIVHYYERVSDLHHMFLAPLNTDRFHVSTYASNGYLVLQPDIVFEIGKPGTSALDCVTAAVRQVLSLGYADPAHIGLQGHSWGGYESAFIITQTNMFATAVIGAPPSNFVSLYNSVFKNLGLVNNGMAEVGQMRMGDGATPWNAHDLYESQSPVHQAAKINTPFLILHGTADLAVDYNQALELFGSARRLGKRVILLSYPDEGHHLNRRENQVDFQIRMKQYFDHYLMGAPAPKWMQRGVPQTSKGEPPQ